HQVLREFVIERQQVIEFFTIVIPAQRIAVVKANRLAFVEGKTTAHRYIGDIRQVIGGLRIQRLRFDIGLHQRAGNPRRKTNSLQLIKRKGRLVLVRLLVEIIQAGGQVQTVIQEAAVQLQFGGELFVVRFVLNGVAESWRQRHDDADIQIALTDEEFDFAKIRFASQVRIEGFDICAVGFIGSYQWRRQRAAEEYTANRRNIVELRIVGLLHNIDRAGRRHIDPLCGQQ